QWRNECKAGGGGGVTPARPRRPGGHPTSALPPGRGNFGITAGGGVRGDAPCHGVVPRPVRSYRMRPERMRMQQAAEILMAEVDALVVRVKSSAANAADHLERSAEAVLFNIGEGVAAHRPKVKIAAYEIAKREANEVRAILRRLVIGKRLDQNDIRR